jgi:hypothetical protein
MVPRSSRRFRTYSEVKDDVVDVIIAVAESWASETGWAPHTKPAR